MEWSLAPRRRALANALQQVEDRLQGIREALEAMPLEYRGRDLTTPVTTFGRTSPAQNYVRLYQRMVADEEVRQALQEEVMDLDLGRITEKACTGRLLLVMNRIKSASDLSRYRDADPELFAESGYHPLAPVIVTNLINRRDKIFGGRFADLAAVRSTKGMTDTLLDGLLLTADPRHPLVMPPIKGHHTVGVMLPARIETRFYPPRASSVTTEWRLRLRIIPDEPFFDRHNPEMTQFEAESTDQFLAALPDGCLTARNKREDAAIRVLWQQFTDIHGGARAAWLVRQRTQNPGARVPASANDEPYYGKLHGLPSQIEVWLVRTRRRPVKVATLQVSAKPDELTLDIPAIDPDNPSASDTDRWWSSWEAARRVGLATEITLGTKKPDDIEALYVVGLGESDPADLFAAHYHSGRLGVIPLGSPTNTVDGEPAADLAKDAETWRRIALAASPGHVSKDISRYLTGQHEFPGDIPGANENTRTLNSAMVAALWPALWGHSLKHIWKLGQSVDDAGLWASQNLVPEGPLPPIRIGDVPYGLLPVTTLGRWQPSTDADPLLEEQLRPTLRQLGQIWTSKANAAGTIENADTSKVLDLLGHTASSGNFDFTNYMPLSLVQAAFAGIGVVLTDDDMKQAWEEANVEVKQFLGNQPDGPRYVSFGWQQKLKIPLVLPENTTSAQLADQLRQIANHVRPADNSWLEKGIPWLEVGDSLLLRLALRSCMITFAELALKFGSGSKDDFVEPVTSNDQRTGIVHLVNQYDPAWLIGNNSVQALQIASTRAGLQSMANALDRGLPVEALERMLRATIDAAIYRLDPWFTGYAWRRLCDLVPRRESVRYQIGLYGWLDAPRPGRAGPTQGGLLHAPSDAQAMTAVIMRDKAIHAAPGEEDLWQMNLRSDVVRKAERLSNQVRIGVHLWEALGNEVEHIVRDHQTIKKLRKNYPMRPEHAGCRVCNGDVILNVVRDHPQDYASMLDLKLTPEQADQFVLLVAAIDAYGDLLVAQAVHYVVSGQTAIAGAAMDAAAGLAAPPNLEVLHTPRQGRGISTSVVVALPVSATMGASTTPGRVAEPALADYLASSAFLMKDSWTISFTTSKLAAAPQIKQTTLQALGLEPVDTLILSADALTELARAQLQPGANASPLPTGALALQARAKELVSVLGSQPALPADLADDGTRPADDPVRQNLLNRYERLHALANETAAALQQAVQAADQQAALHSALRWGVVPMTTDIPAATPDDDRLAILCERAAAAMADRINGAPAVSDVYAEFSPAQIATAIAELVSPDGKFAVLGHLPLRNVSSTLRPVMSKPDAPEQPESDWLSTVAAVRLRIAHLEAYQMGALLDAERSPLQVWTNRPTDLWQANEPPVDLTSGIIPQTKLIMAYGPQGTIDRDPDATIAFGLLDSWNETIPYAHHSTTAAVGFNAPAARPQQAILLAVPPVEGRPLDTPTLLSILQETRALARMRMVRHDNLVDFRTALPFTVIPSGSDLSAWP